MSKLYEAAARLNYTQEVSGLTLNVRPDQILPLALALGVYPEQDETVALLDAIAEAMPQEWRNRLVGIEAPRAEARLKKLYQTFVEVAPKTTAKPTIVGKQMTGTTSYIRWVRGIDEVTDSFFYTENRNAAMVFPSRNAAQNAVRRRFESFAKSGVAVNDRFTDFFTEVAAPPVEQAFTTSRFESTHGGSPFAPKVDRTLNRHEEGAPFDEPAPRPTDVTDTELARDFKVATGPQIKQAFAEFLNFIDHLNRDAR